jgi:hypothetical protein
MFRRRLGSRGHAKLLDDANRRRSEACYFNFSSSPSGRADLPPGDAFRQDLDGDCAAKPRVARLIHLAHASRTEGPEDFVRAEFVA